MAEGSKPGKGIPRSAGKASKKAKHNRYLAKASCFVCKLVFRSPQYKKRHIAMNHQLMAGVNRKRPYVMAT